MIAQAKSLEEGLIYIPAKTVS